jgi:hypothetical protein
VNWTFWGAYVVNANTDHPEEAFELLTRLTDGEIQGQIAELGANIPSRTDDPDTIDTFLTFTPPENNQAFIDGLNSSVPEGPLWEGDWPAFDTIMAPAIEAWSPARSPWTSSRPPSASSSTRPSTDPPDPGSPRELPPPRGDPATPRSAATSVAADRRGAATLRSHRRHDRGRSPMASITLPSFRPPRLLEAATWLRLLLVWRVLHALLAIAGAALVLGGTSRDRPGSRA